MNEILVVVEYRNQTLADATLQAISKGRQLADQTGVELVAVVIGKNLGDYARTLAKWADRVLAVSNQDLENSLAEPYQSMLSSLIRERKPRIVLMGHTSFGMELAPSLAVELEALLATDCIDIMMEGDAILATRSVYNGKVRATYSLVSGDTVVITTRVGEFAVAEGNRQGQIEELPLPLSPEFKYKEFEGYLEPAAGGVDIAQASVLVSIGRGIREKENIEMAEKLAEMLGGVVSCSRPVVDCGWLPPDRQVGLSGKTVSPKLYLALGISGAFQHLVGVKGSKLTVAINKDAHAPIFSIADYGIVDDMFRVVPELIKKIIEYKGCDRT
jgi:electron transfer flavoprotein alpha subunit